MRLRHRKSNVVRAAQPAAVELLEGRKYFAANLVNVNRTLDVGSAVLTVRGAYAANSSGSPDPLDLIGAGFSVTSNLTDFGATFAGPLTKAALRGLAINSSLFGGAVDVTKLFQDLGNGASQGKIVSDGIQIAADGLSTGSLFVDAAAAGGTAAELAAAGATAGWLGAAGIVLAADVWLYQNQNQVITAMVQADLPTVAQIKSGLASAVTGIFNDAVAVGNASGAAVSAAESTLSSAASNYLNQADAAATAAGVAPSDMAMNISGTGFTISEQSDDTAVPVASGIVSLSNTGAPYTSYVSIAGASGGQLVNGWVDSSGNLATLLNGSTIGSSMTAFAPPGGPAFSSIDYLGQDGGKGPLVDQVVNNLSNPVQPASTEYVTGGTTNWYGSWNAQGDLQCSSVNTASGMTSSFYTASDQTTPYQVVVQAPDSSGAMTDQSVTSNYTVSNTSVTYNYALPAGSTADVLYFNDTGSAAVLQSETRTLSSGGTQNIFYNNGDSTQIRQLDTFLNDGTLASSMVNTPSGSTLYVYQGTRAGVTSQTITYSTPDGPEGSAPVVTQQLDNLTDGTSSLTTYPSDGSSPTTTYYSQPDIGGTVIGNVTGGDPTSDPFTVVPPATDPTPPVVSEPTPPVETDPTAPEPPAESTPVDPVDDPPANDPDPVSPPQEISDGGDGGDFADFSMEAAAASKVAAAGPIVPAILSTTLAPTATAGQSERGRVRVAITNATKTAVVETDQINVELVRHDSSGTAVVDSLSFKRRFSIGAGRDQTIQLPVDFKLPAGAYTMQTAVVDGKTDVASIAVGDSEIEVVPSAAKLSLSLAKLSDDVFVATLKNIGNAPFSSTATIAFEVDDGGKATFVSVTPRRLGLPAGRSELLRFRLPARTAAGKFGTAKIDVSGPAVTAGLTAIVGTPAA